MRIAAKITAWFLVLVVLLLMGFYFLAMGVAWLVNRFRRPERAFVRQLYYAHMVRTRRF